MRRNVWSDLQLKFDEEIFVDLDEVAEDAELRAITVAEARQISEVARATLDGLGHAATGRYEESSFRGKDWFGDYMKLREQGWPWRVACYIAWASSPKLERWPQTLKDLASEVLGLMSPRVVYHWRRKYPSIDTVVAMMQAAPLWEHRRDVFEALIAMAGNPDYKSFNDRKLFLEMVGDYTPRSKLEVGKAVKDDLSELSDAELDALMGEKTNTETAEIATSQASGEASKPAPRNDKNGEGAGRGSPASCEDGEG